MSEQRVGTGTLFEREGQLWSLARRLTAARARRGSSMTVGGPLGVGRSALLDATARMAGRSGARVLRARAAVTESSFAFGVTRQLLGPESPGRLTAADDPTQTVLAALTDVVASMARRQPLLLIVDDLQWADMSSLRWLGYLARRVEGLPVMVVTALTDGDPRPEPALIHDITTSGTTLRLRRLGQRGIRAMVTESYGDEVTEEFVRACRDATGGSPLFLTTLLQCMAADGLPPDPAPVDAIAAGRPGRLRERLAGRLRDRLIAYLGSQPGLREVARALAILGDRADPEFTARVAGIDEAGHASAIRSLSSLGLLAAGDAVALHPIVRDAVEESMTSTEREAARLRAAHLLHRAEQPPERIAAQLLTVVGPLEPWAVVVLRAGAEHAVRHHDPRLAARYLRRALQDCPADGDLRPHLLVDLAAAERGLDPASSTRHLARALPLLPPRDRAAAVVRFAPTVAGAALSPWEQILTGATTGAHDTGPREADDELSVSVEARLRYLRTGERSSATGAVERLAALGTDPPLGTRAERELVIVLLYAATTGTSLPAAEVIRHAHRVLAAQAPLPDHVHTAFPLLVNVLYAADSVIEADAWLATAYDRLDEQDGDAGRGLIRTEQAVMAMGRGDLDRARAFATEAYDLVGKVFDETNAMCTTALAAVAAELRHRPLTERILRRDRREQPDRLGMSAVLGMVRASAAVSSGNLPVALSQLREIGRQWEDTGYLNPALYSWRIWTALVHHRMRDTPAAIAQAEAAHDAALTWGAPATVGRALRVRGLVTEGRAGIGLLREARDVLTGSCNRLELAKARVLLGRRLREAGETEAAAEELREGRQLARECGAGWLTFDSGPHVDGQPSWSRPAPRAVLTAAEQRVARLAAAGHTNQEIAEALEVGSRAVEKHLTNSYRKLGVRGRTGLVEALRSRP